MLKSSSNVIIALIWFSNCKWAYSDLEIGDPCGTPYRSNCQPQDRCHTLPGYLERNVLTARTVVGCGFTSVTEKICCPLDDVTKMAMPAPIPTTTTTTTTTTTAKTITTTTSKDITTERPEWLDLFNTNREYVQRSIAVPIPNRDGILFRDTSDGATCVAPLYEGQCLAISQCPSVEPLLAQGRLRDDDFTTCRDGTVEEIICCPTNLPIHPRGPVAGDEVNSIPRLGIGDISTPSSSTNVIDDLDTAAIARADSLLPHYNHLAALAYPNAAFDGHVYECTALALTPDLLVSAAGCQRPTHAVFGVADLRDVDEDEDYLVDIVRLAHHQNDLALMRLAKPLILGTETTSNVTLAPICTQFELTRLQASGQLVATAWGKGKDTDCPLYELPMRLLPTTDCADLLNLGNVRGLSATHLCLEPKNLNDLQMFSNSSRCSTCPAIVGSVLHLIRPNGNRCVLGLATPTGANCEAKEMYFTSLLNAQFTYFVEQQQRL